MAERNGRGREGGSGYVAGPGKEAGAGYEGGEDLATLVGRIAELAKAGEAVEAYASRSVSTSIRAYEAEIEQLSSSTSSGVGVRVISDGRQGFSYAGFTSDVSPVELLAQARENARFAGADEYASVAQPDGVTAPVLVTVDTAMADVPTAKKVELALELEAAARTADKRVRKVESADYDDVVACEAIATSTGLRAFSEYSYAALSVQVVAGDGDSSQSGTGFEVARGIVGLEPEAIAAEGIERATRLLGAIKPATAECTVVFDPRVTSTFLSVLAAAFSGESVTKGRSFLAGRVGEAVMRAGLDLLDDPTDAQALSAGPYDGEGLASRPNLLVADGVLRGYVFDSTAGKRAGCPSTGSAVRSGYSSGPVASCRALLLSDTVSPGMSAPDILVGVGDGLYVQSVTGAHSGINPVSGDFSVGVEGLRLRDGAFAEPVREATVASTLQKMLIAVLYAGADVQWLPGIAAGQTLAIGSMMLSGT